MRDKLFGSFTKAIYKDRFLLLIIIIVAMIVLGPFLEGFIGLQFFMDLLFSIIFVATIYAASQKRNHIIIAIVLLLPTLFALWTDDIPINNTLLTIGYICGLILFAFAVISIVSYIFSEELVTRQTISAAVVVYLLIALMWSFIYRLLVILYPASFAIAYDKLQDAENIY